MTTTPMTGKSDGKKPIPPADFFLPVTKGVTTPDDSGKMAAAEFPPLHSGKRAAIPPKSEICGNCDAVESL